MCCFRGIVAGWRGKNRVGRHLFQELRDLRGVGSHGDEVLGGRIYFGFRRWRGWRSWRSFAVGQSDIRSKQRDVGASLPLRLNGVFRSLVGWDAGRALLLGFLRILRGGTEQASLLGK